MKNTNKKTLRKNLLFSISQLLTEHYPTYGSVEIKVDSISIEIVVDYNKINVCCNDTIHYNILYMQFVEVFSQIAVLIFEGVYLKDGIEVIEKDKMVNLFPYLFTSIGFEPDKYKEGNHGLFIKRLIEGTINNHYYYYKVKQNSVESDIPDLSKYIAKTIVDSYTSRQESVQKIKMKKCTLTLKFG